MELKKIERPELSNGGILEDPRTAEEKENGVPFCKYGCGLCAFCDQHYAGGHCSHTAYISGIDQGGHRLKAHMMKEHLAVYEYPKWRLATDNEIARHLEQLEESFHESNYDWIREAVLIRFVEDITTEKLRLKKYPHQCIDEV